jgi:hypothetical protein
MDNDNRNQIQVLQKSIRRLQRSTFGFGALFAFMILAGAVPPTIINNDLVVKGVLRCLRLHTAESVVFAGNVEASQNLSVKGNLTGPDIESLQGAVETLQAEVETLKTKLGTLDAANLARLERIAKGEYFAIESQCGANYVLDVDQGAIGGNAKMQPGGYLNKANRGFRIALP